MIYGKDYLGQVCGTVNDPLTTSNGIVLGGMDLSDRQMVTFPRVTFDILESTTSGGFNPKSPLTTINSLSLTGVCVSTCPQEGDFVCMYEAEDGTKLENECVTS